MNNYFNEYHLEENIDFLKVATLLDPKFKKLSFLPFNLHKVFYRDAKNKIKTAFDKFKSNKEIKKYIHEPKDDIEKFYTQNTVFKKLIQAVKYFLICPATSVPTERIFSGAEFQENIRFDN